MSLPFAFKLPLRTAVVAVTELAAMVVTIGWGGEATRAKLCWDVGALFTPAKIPPALSPAVLTATGMLLCSVELSPNSPSPLNPQETRVPSAHKARVCIAPAVREETVLPVRIPPVCTATKDHPTISCFLPQIFLADPLFGFPCNPLLYRLCERKL